MTGTSVRAGRGATPNALFASAQYNPTMPSVSPKQARLMAAVAHGWKKPGGGGPSVEVAREFNEADKGTGILESIAHKKRRKGRLERMTGG